MSIENKLGLGRRTGDVDIPEPPALEAPVFASLPTVSGTPVVGQTLSGSPGALTGTPPPTLTHEWLRDGAPIDGATAASYVLIAADDDTDIQYRVTATNSEGSDTATSAAEIVTAPLATNTAPAAVGGTTEEGETLTASPGTWSGIGVVVSGQWRRNSTPIPSATALTYVLTADDDGALIDFFETATTSGGSTTQGSNVLDVQFQRAAPLNTTPPSIAGTGYAGDTLTATPGVWTGEPVPAVTGEWRVGGLGTGNTTLSYIVQSGDVGQAVTYVETATNMMGSDTAPSAPITALASLFAPVNTTPPSISGSAYVGDTLTATLGVWDGNPAPTVGGEWHVGGSAIGNTGASYVIQAGDVGSAITYVEDASNSQGNDTVASNAVTALAALTQPTNTSAPSISGAGRVGDTMSAMSGTWAGNPTPDVGGEWHVAGIGTGDVDTSYVVQVGDVGKAITYVETATNSEGFETAASNAITGLAALSSPTNVAPASIAGTGRVGDTLTATPGSWGGNPTPGIAGEWRVDYLPTGDIDLTYTVQPADLGFDIDYVETATNSQGSVTQSSNIIVGAAALGAPTNLAGPTIAGTGRVGDTLTATPGSWDGNPAPTVFGEWRVDGSGTGDTDTSYIVQAGDLGLAITYRETATNSEGSNVATSDPIVGAPPLAAPTNDTPAVISGTGRVGELLTVAAGAWSGEPTPNVTGEWRVDGVGTGETGTDYTVQPADLVGLITYVETATNSEGSASQASNAIMGSAALAAPANTAAPSISGTGRVGEALVAVAGTWSGNPTPNITTEWYVDGAGTGDADTLYTVQPADDGLDITYVETATNNQGSDTATSNAITASPALAAPTNDTPPSIAGTGRVGETLAASSGSWSGNPTPSVSGEWHVDGSPTANTDTSYTVQPADDGASITYVETATNSEGSDTATSNAVVGTPALAAPTNDTAPIISGTGRAGDTMTATPGSWLGNPAPSVGGEWYVDGAGTGDTDASYVVQVGDVGSDITYVETATNSQGSDTATSNAITATAALAPPVNTVAASISGTGRVGEALTATPGAWTGNPTPSVGGEWRVDAAPTGDTGLAYTVGSGDLGASITYVETATNSEGSADQASNAITAIPALAAPVNTAAPTIAGSGRVGETLAATPGAWSGNPTPSVAGEWYVNSVATGDTDTSYTVQPADNGLDITYVEAASNSEGSVSQSSNAIAGAPALAAPTTDTAPVIAGTGEAGSDLTATPGTWSGNPTPSVSGEWYVDGVATGDTDTTYMVLEADDGLDITYAETATNSEGSASATSNAITASVAAGGPWTPADETSTLAWFDPDDAGNITTAAGNEITAWVSKVGARALTRENSTGPTLGGVQINGKDGVAADDDNTLSNDTWTHPTGDIMYVIVANVTATPSADRSILGFDGDSGTDSFQLQARYSNQFRGTIKTWNLGGDSHGPNRFNAPTIFVMVFDDTGDEVRNYQTGTEVTTPLSTSNAIDSSGTFVYGGRRWGDGGATATIGDVIVFNDVSDAVRQQAEGYLAHKWGLTADLPVDHPYKTEAPGGGASGPDPAAPTNDTLPVIAGTGRAGEVLTATPGTWSGEPTPTVTGEWHVDAVGVGDTDTSYTVQVGDIGQAITYVETGSNSEGSDTVTSNSITGAAALAAPTNDTAPTISGTGASGEDLTATPGTWSGNPAPTVGGEWHVDGSPTGDTDTTYTVQVGDDGLDITYVETATNSEGSDTATSNAITGVAPSAAWTPADEPDCLAWFDPDDTANMTLDGDNDILSWTSKVGSRVLTAGNDSVRLGGGQINGKDGVFNDDANDNYMTSGTGWTHSTGDMIFATIANIDHGSNSNDSIFAFQASGPDFQIRAGHNTRWYGQFRQSNMGSNISPNTDIRGQTTIYTLDLESGPGTNELFHNGTSVGTGSASSIHTTGEFILFGNRGRTRAPTGVIGDMIIMNTSDPVVRQKIEGYLAHKWNATDALPADHPYKSSAP